MFGATPMKKLCAGMSGTFALVLAGTGTIIINDASESAITHVGCVSGRAV
jgi:hypothetical protein